MASNGSIEYRGGDTYRLIISCGLNSEGKQIKKSRTIHASSKDAAQKELDKFITEIDAGFDTDAAKLSFEKFVVERWLPKHAEKELAQKTIYDYKGYLRIRIFPALGHLKISKIRPSHIIEFLEMIQDDNMRFDKRLHQKKNIRKHCYALFSFNIKYLFHCSTLADHSRKPV